MAIEDFISSEISRRVTERITRRRQNEAINRRFLLDPRKLDRSLAEIGERFLTTDQLLDVDKDLYKRDPLRAIEEVFPEDDPRRGLLTESRSDVLGFLQSNPANRQVDPVEVIQRAVRSRVQRRPQEIALAMDRDLDENLISASLSGVVEGVKEVVTPGATELGTAVGTAALVEGLRRSTPRPRFEITKAGKGRFKSGQLIGRLKPPTFEKRTSKLNTFARAVSSQSKKQSGLLRLVRGAGKIAKIASFIPGPTMPIARFLSLGLGVLEAQQLALGAMKFVDETAERSGFKRDHPIASMGLQIAAGAAAPVGAARTAYRSAKLFGGSLESRLADAAFTQRSKGRRPIGIYTALNDHLRVADFIRSPGSSVEVNSGKFLKALIDTSRKLRKEQRNLVDYMNDVSNTINQSSSAITRTQRLLQAGESAGLRLTPEGVESLAPGSRVRGLLPAPKQPARKPSEFPRNRKISPKNFLKGMRRDLGLTPQIVRGISKMNQQATQKLDKVPKVGVKKTLAQSRLQTESTTTFAGPSEALKAKREFIQDSTIPTSVKEKFNQSISKYAEKGLNDSEATAKAFEDIAGDISQAKTQPIAQTPPKEFQSEALKDVAQTARPLRDPADKFGFAEYHEFEKTIVDEAAKRGKAVKDLSDTDMDEILKKSGLLGIASLVTLGSLTIDAEVAEAGVIDSSAKVFSKLAQRFAKGDTKAQKYDALIEDFLKKIDEPPEVKDSYYNIADDGKAMRDFTLRAKRELGIELDRTVAEESAVGISKRTGGNIFNNFRKFGEAGALTTAKFKLIDDLSEIALVKFEERLKNALPLSNKFLGKRRRNLTKEEGKIVHDLLIGKRTTARRDLVETKNQIRALLDEVHATAGKQGIPLAGYRHDYFPQILKAEALGTPAGRARVIDHLVETGQVANFDEAVKVVGRMIRDKQFHLFNENTTAVRKAGNLEFSRRYTFPEDLYVGGDGRHLLEGLTVYASQAFQRVERARFLGLKNERLNALKVKMKQDFPDQAEYIDKSLDVLLGVRPLDATFRAPEGFKKFVNFSRTLETLDLLGYAQISQLGQLVFLSAKVNPANMVKGIKKLIFPDTQVRGQDRVDFIRSSAVVSQVQAQHVAEQFGAITGTARQVTDKALKAYLVLPTDRMMRFVAGSAGLEYTKNLAMKLGRKLPAKELETAKRHLRELNLDPDDILKRVQSGKKDYDIFSDQELQIAIKRISDSTQFRTRPGDLPLWFASDYAKLVTQFKSFLFQAGSGVNQLIVREAQLGNYAPLATAGISAPIVGHFVAQARDNLKLQVADTFGDRELARRTKKRKKYLNDRSGGVLKKPRDALVGKSIAEVFNDATYVMALGVLPDLIMDTLSTKRLQVSSPTIDRVSRIVGAVVNDTLEGETKQIEREFRRLVPLGLNERR